MEGSQPPGTILCLLCRGVISFKGGDKTRFESHVLHEHEAYFGLDVLLAISFIKEEERQAIVNVVTPRYDGKEEGGNTGNKSSAVVGDMKAALENYVKIEKDNATVKEEILENSVVIEEMPSDDSVNENDKIYGIPETTMMKCRYCPRTFINRHSLRRHEVKHNEQKYPCHKCEKKFSFLEDLKHHRLTHVSMIQQEEEIDDEMYVIRESDVPNHHIEVDTSSQSYDDQMDSESSIRDSYLRCKVCNKVMKKESYPIHKLIHKDDRKYGCNFCETKFRRNEHLKKHIYRCHKGNTSKISLNSTEEEKSTFKCTICSKDFYAEETLKSHMKVHFPQGLKQHIPSVSKVRLDLTCGICGKEFTTANNLRRHTSRLHGYKNDASEDVDEESDLYMTMR